MARPSKLTPELADDICKAIKAGNTADTAAAFAGVCRQTLRTWLRRGARASRGMYREFLDTVKRAQAEAEVRHVANILRAGSKGVWTASAWWLERRRPRDWASDRRELAAALKRIAALEAREKDASGPGDATASGPPGAPPAQPQPAPAGPAAVP